MMKTTITHFGNLRVQAMNLMRSSAVERHTLLFLIGPSARASAGWPTLLFNHGTVSISHMAHNVSHTRSRPPPPLLLFLRPHRPHPHPTRSPLTGLIPAGHTEAPALNTPALEEGD